MSTTLDPNLEREAFRADQRKVKRVRTVKTPICHINFRKLRQNDLPKCRIKLF